MAIVLPQCRILHTPKTGGSWVNTAIARAGIPHAKSPRAYEHVTLQNSPGQALFTIAFVREPWSWWKSYWVFKRGNGWDRTNPFDMFCLSDTFEGFLTKALERCPGYWTRVCELYVGPADAPIQFIGRFERLAEDLIAGLECAGEKFNPQAIRETRPENLGDYRAFPPICSHELQQRILAAEEAGRRRFSY